MLGKKGSFSSMGINPSTSSDIDPQIYTLSDLRELVQYADARGIEVIPEIDMPAHTG